MENELLEHWVARIRKWTLGSAAIMMVLLILDSYSIYIFPDIFAESITNWHATKVHGALFAMSLAVSIGVPLCGIFIMIPGYMSNDIKKDRIAHGCCPECGYDLRESHLRCPECGHESSSLSSKD